MKTLRYLWPALLLAGSCAAADSGQTLVSAELKSEPFLDARTLATLPPSSCLEILKRQGGWLRVKPANIPDGWLKMTAVKQGDVTHAKGESGLAELWSVAQSGRSGSNGVVVATGVRGLGVDDLKNASANPDALKQVQGYAVSRPDAEAYAAQARLRRQSVDFIAEGGSASAGGPASWFSGKGAK